MYYSGQNSHVTYNKQSDPSAVVGNLWLFSYSVRRAFNMF